MYKVMIIDDEPFILDGLDNIIPWEEYGVEIAAKATNGIEALDLLKKMNINILITDIMMPEMDGLELIKNIRLLGLDIKIIILSGYDDFHFVKEAAKMGIENYLLKPIEEEELQATLQNTVDKLKNEINTKIRARKDYNLLRENILYRWVMNNISDDELKNRAEFLNLDLDADYYMACIIRLLKRPENWCNDDKDPGLLLFAIQNIASEILGNYGNSLVFPTIQGDLAILFSWNGNGFDLETATDLLSQCITNINKYLQSDVFIAMGPAGLGYRQAHLSFSKAFKLLDYQIVMPRNSIISFENINKYQIKDRIVPKIDYEKFRKLLVSKDKLQSIQFIDDIFAKLSEVDVLTPEYVRNLTLEIMINISEAFNGRCELAIYEDNFFADMLSNMLQAHSLDELSSQLKTCVEEMIDRYDSLYRDASPFIVTLLQYIDQNYMEEMSLKTLSVKFKVNAAYLGQQFKNATGEIFSRYLNRVRIEKAKEMLAGTDMKTGDIAASVGYSSVNYFSNLFKKMTGIYPSEYRNEYRKKIS